MLSVWRIPPGIEKDSDNDHPCPYPIRLVSPIISSCVFDRGCIDPYMGSGTTGVACVNMGKDFTGIERERKYFDIACRRIEQAYAQPRLFEDAKVGAGETAVQGDMLLTANALAQASGAKEVEETTCGCTASPGAMGSTIPLNNGEKA